MRLRLITGFVVLVTIIGGWTLGRDLVANASGGGYSHDGADATAASRLLNGTFEQGRPNLVLVVTALGGDITDPAVQSVATDLVGQLEERSINDVTSWWKLGASEYLASTDGSSAMITGRMPGLPDNYAARTGALLRSLDIDRNVVDVAVGGDVVQALDIRNGTFNAFAPMLLLLLLALFLVGFFLRAVRSALLVTATVVFSGALVLIALSLISRFVELPALSILLAVGVGLGLTSASGYLMMDRFVDELQEGAGRQAAVMATITTAGRTVAILATSALGLGMSLVILPTAILRSTGYSIAAAATVSGLCSVLGLGFLLSMYGTEVEPQFTRLTSRLSFGSPKWVVERPLLVVLVAAAILLPAAWLGAGVPTTEPGPATLDPSASSRRTADRVFAEFESNDADATFIIGRNLVTTGRSDQLLSEYTAAISQVEGVARVDSAQGTYIDGERVGTDAATADRFSAEDATWFLVPFETNARGSAARRALAGIEAIDAPFRVSVGGPTAAQIDTVGAVSGRAPLFYLLALSIVFLVMGWLLKSIRAGVRAAGLVLLLCGAIGLVIRFGFIGGLLSPILGFTDSRAVAVFAMPLTWVLAAIVAGSILVPGWSVVRESFDASGGSNRAVHTALRSTGPVHIKASILLMLPFVGLLFAQWRSAQLIGAGVLVVGGAALTVGRFVLLPAVVSFRRWSLWPVAANGEPNRVYPDTAANARWATLAVLSESHLPSEIGIDPDAVIDRSFGRTTAPTATVERTTMVEAPTGEPALEISVTRSHTSVGASAPPVPDVVEESSPEEQPQIEQPAMQEPVLEQIDEPEIDVAAAHAAGVHAPSADHEIAGPATIEAVVAQEPVAREPVVQESVVHEPAAVEPVTVEAVFAPGEPVEGERSLVDEVAADQVMIEEVAAPSSTPETTDAPPAVIEIESDQVRDLHVAETAEPPAAAITPAKPSSPLAERLATVDVVSLTESVIASIDADQAFTTEIGSGFVANPSNNLSRVMEAILRDASSRGGEEVLVYGHASRDRYRWMVVDSGPVADSDPDRARTLAEAQRFIRRVGGIVECRPQGDFTVFVVEIPMAS